MRIAEQISARKIQESVANAKTTRFIRAALVPLLVIASWSCTATESSGSGGNTNWVECRTDADCDPGRRCTVDSRCASMSADGGGGASPALASDAAPDASDHDSAASVVDAGSPDSRADGAPARDAASDALGDTGPSTPDANAVGCSGPEDCNPPAFCNYRDDLCGSGEVTGVCVSVFDQASPEANVCSCDGLVYGHRFITYGQANVDISRHAECDPHNGTFRCPAMPWAHCFDGTYCERSASPPTYPDDITDNRYDCNPLPVGCNECDCLPAPHCPGEATCVGTSATGFSVLCLDSSANLNDAGLDCPLGGAGCNAIVGVIGGQRLDVRDACYQVGGAFQDVVLASAPIGDVCASGSPESELVLRLSTTGAYEEALYYQAPAATPFPATDGSVSIDNFSLTQRMAGTFDITFGTDRVCGCFDVVAR